jgi:beta-glucanase (GH16 family)
MLWSDEFDGGPESPVDLNTWVFNIGDGSDYGIAGWGNSEREYYIESAAQIGADSNLHIRATRMPVVTESNPTGAVSDANPYPAYYGTAAEWTSAKLTTFEKVSLQYGRVEARIKAPRGLGTWPAFWMLGTDIETVPWPQCGEIDIMEGRGDLPSTLYGTLHGPGYSGEFGKGKVVDTGTTLSDDFHVYAVDWLPNQISWFFDDECYAITRAEDLGELEWVYNKPFYIIMNLAMGGHFTGPIAEDLESAELQIDYVRHYSIDGVGSFVRRS